MEIVPTPWIKLRGGHDSSQKMVIYRSLCECICCCSVIQLCLTLRPDGLQHARLPCPSLSRSLLKLMCTSDATQSSHPLLSPSPPAFNLSQHQGLFQWVSSLHQRAKYWSFGFSISPSNEYSVYFPLGWTSLISLLSKGQTLKSLLQHNSSKASFFSSRSSLWSNSHISTWLLEKP